jgi:hypothetical protein
MLDIILAAMYANYSFVMVLPYQYSSLCCLLGIQSSTFSSICHFAGYIWNRPNILIWNFQVDIQALAHAVELTRQGSVDSLKFAKGDLILAFQVSYGLFKIC